jgi:hypothetical protein
MTVSVSGLCSIGGRMINEFEEIVMKIGSWNWNTQRKRTPVPLFASQIPRDLTWDWTQVTMQGTLWPAAFAVTWPIKDKVKLSLCLTN